MAKEETIHTSRTMMFDELSRVMDHAIGDDKYLDSLEANIANKLTKTNQTKTARYLKQLYDFDFAKVSFIAFKYFWQITDAEQRPLLTLLYALNKDYLLIESISVIAEAKTGELVPVERFENNIETYHPGRYSEKTRRSVARNVASSWKQAGFMTGKVKAMRTQPVMTYQVVAFAFLLAYLHEQKGDFILASRWSRALCLGDTPLRELALEAAKRDLLQYQYAGSVTSVSFNNLFNKLGIDGI